MYFNRHNEELEGVFRGDFNKHNGDKEGDLEKTILTFPRPQPVGYSLRAGPFLKEDRERFYKEG